MSRKARRTAGLLAIVFYLAVAARYLARGQPENLLWSCHLAVLAVGLGLVLRAPGLIAIGFLWETVGVPLWLLDLASGGELEPTSLLTHVGGLVLGGLGVATLGLPHGAWWKALLALAGLHAVTRWTTPPAENVNLAFAVWGGWEPWFPSHRVYLLFLATVSAGVFFGVCLLARRTGLAEPPPALGVEPAP